MLHYNHRLIINGGYVGCNLWNIYMGQFSQDGNWWSCDHNFESRTKSRGPLVLSHVVHNRKCVLDHAESLKSVFLGLIFDMICEIHENLPTSAYVSLTPLILTLIWIFHLAPFAHFHRTVSCKILDNRSLDVSYLLKK
jgi:hypothetical protein